MTCACGAPLSPTAKRCRACYIASWENYERLPKHPKEPCACGRMMRSGSQTCMPCRRDVPSRLLRSISKESGGCWVWTGARGADRYGRMTINGRHMLVHRAVYEMAVGPIPEGLELDHLCRNPSCCNPEHLEPVTHAENMRRGESYNRNRTHCQNGHPYTPANTRFSKQGWRKCRQCDNARGRAIRRRVSMDATDADPAESNGETT